MLLRSLTPASRRQDHATSPSASALFVQQRLRVHRIPCRVDDVGQRPSFGRDTRLNASDLPDVLSGIFSPGDLDTPQLQGDLICPSGARTGSPETQVGMAGGAPHPT